MHVYTSGAPPTQGDPCIDVITMIGEKRKRLLWSTEANIVIDRRLSSVPPVLTNCLECFFLTDRLYPFILNCAGKGEYICLMYCISVGIRQKVNRRNCAQFKRVFNVKRPFYIGKVLRREYGSKDEDDCRGKLSFSEWNC